MQVKLKPGQQKKGPKTKIAKVKYFADGVRANLLRKEGNSWDEIAEQLAIGGTNPANTALKMARDAREKEEEETAKELRLVHHDRYEFMFKSLVPKIILGRERAIEVAAQVLEKDAKLMGINADAEQTQGNFQPILISIQPHPSDPEARKLAAKDLVIEQQPKLLPPPDKSV